MAISLWILGAAANGIISAAYLAIAYVIFQGLVRSGGIRGNPLGLATGLIFLSCGLGHGVHAIHTLLPPLGIDVATGLAARVEMADWPMWTIDGLTALVGVWYWTLRGRFPALVRGGAIFEDMRVRQQEALDIHDRIVQGLARAKLNFEMDRPQEGLRDIDATLTESRAIITRLLGKEGSEMALRPGELRRANASPRRAGP